MSTIRQYRPNFIDIDDPLETAAADTVGEFDGIPWLARWRDAPGFDHFALSAFDTEPGGRVMAILNGGAQWWVIGHVDGPIEGLADWHAPQPE